MNVLCVTWDGAGNLPPMLGTARELTARGHEVSVLSHRRPRAWIESTGSTFVPYTDTPEYDSVRPHATGGDELPFLWHQVWFSSSVARDVARELRRRPADVVVADHQLAGALCAADQAAVPTVVLFHQPSGIYHTGPMAELWRTATPQVTAIQDALGLAPVPEPQQLWAGRPWAVASVPELDLPLSPPADAHHTGPVYEHPPDTPAHVPLPAGRDPLVVVSLSTSQMGQAPLLQSIVDALGTLPLRVVATTGLVIDPATLVAPPNTTVVEYVRHEQLLPHAAVVVTHAGHGTTLAALAHGVPLVCVPMGRDQSFLAARVEELGAGRQLVPDSVPEDLAAAVEGVLADPATTKTAQQLAASIARYRGAAAATRVVTAAASTAAT